MDGKKTLADIGERDLLARARHFVDDGDLPFGEDASAIRLNSTQSLVVNVDMLVESTDVPEGMSLEDCGWKAVNMSLSDLAAKGANPLGILISLGLPADLAEDSFERVLQGAKEACDKHGIKLLGGDLNTAKELVIDCAAFGRAEFSSLLRRDGAELGDTVLTTGAFGRTSCALAMLLEGKTAASPSDEKLFREALFRPLAKLQAGLFLSSEGLACSCIDSSDGLAISLHQMADASGVKIVIDDLLVPPDVLRFAEKYGLDPHELILFGGEEFELVFTAKRENLARIVELSANCDGLDLAVLGHVESGSGVFMDIVNVDELTKGVPKESLPDRGKAVARRGFEHFSNG